MTAFPGPPSNEVVGFPYIRSLCSSGSLNNFIISVPGTLEGKTVPTLKCLEIMTYKL